MAYAGRQPTTGFRSTPTKDTFNGDNSTVAFTLSIPTRTNDVEVFVENVQQEPVTAYSISGTTLTFTSAPPTGTGNIYVIHRAELVSNGVHTPSADLTAANATITGDLTVSGTTITMDSASVQTVDLGDNDKIRLGDSDDLQLYWDGTTGQVSNDINVTGTVTADGLTVDGSATIQSATSPSLRFVDTNNVNSDFTIFSPDGQNVLQIKDVDDNTLVDFFPGGDIAFYEDTGTTPKLYWDASAESLGIGTSSPSAKMTVSAGSDARIEVVDTTNSATSFIRSDNTDASIGTSSNHPLNIRTNGNNAITILSTGQLQKSGNSTTARIIPETDNAGYIGQNDRRWQAIYAVNGSIQTSDKRQKTDIQDSQLGLDFISALRPVSYKWISGGKHFEYDEDGNPTITDVAGKRNHYGLLAQEVKEVLGDVDFGGWLISDLDDPESTQSLRYDQFVAPIIKAIQEQQEQIEELKAEKDAQATQIADLVTRIEALEAN